MRDLHVFGIKCTYVRRWRRASQRNNASQHAERQDSRSRANALEKGTVRVGHSTTHRADESGHSCRPGPAVGHSCKPWLSPARAARTTIERQLLTVQRQQKRLASTSQTLPQYAIAHRSWITPGVGGNEGKRQCLGGWGARPNNKRGAVAGLACRTLLVPSATYLSCSCGLWVIL